MAAINHKRIKTTCCHFIWMLIPFIHLAGITEGLENHTLLPFSLTQPLPLHTNAPASMHTLYIFYLPLSLPPFHDSPYFCT